MPKGSVVQFRHPLGPYPLVNRAAKGDRYRIKGSTFEKNIKAPKRPRTLYNRRGKRTVYDI